VTIAQRWNRQMTHFSDCIPVVKRHMTVCCEVLLLYVIVLGRAILVGSLPGAVGNCHCWCSYWLPTAPCKYFVFQFYVFASSMVPALRFCYDSWTYISTFCFIICLLCILNCYCKFDSHLVLFLHLPSLTVSTSFFNVYYVHQGKTDILNGVGHY
jgi:hypothetical protein